MTELWAPKAEEVAAFELTSLVIGEGVPVGVVTDELLVTALDAFDVVAPFLAGSVQLAMPADSNQGAAARLAILSVPGHRRRKALTRDMVAASIARLLQRLQLVTALDLQRAAGPVGCSATRQLFRHGGVTAVDCAKTQCRPDWKPIADGTVFACSARDE